MFTKKGGKLDKVTEEITSVERPDILEDQYLGIDQFFESAMRKKDYP